MRTPRWWPPKDLEFSQPKCPFHLKESFWGTKEAEVWRWKSHWRNLSNLKEKSSKNQDYGFFIRMNNMLHTRGEGSYLQISITIGGKKGINLEYYLITQLTLSLLTSFYPSKKKNSSQVLQRKNLWSKKKNEINLFNGEWPYQPPMFWTKILWSKG